jgi:hypothetical protein
MLERRDETRVRNRSSALVEWGVAYALEFQYVENCDRSTPVKIELTERG